MFWAEGKQQKTKTLHRECAGSVWEQQEGQNSCNTENKRKRQRDKWIKKTPRTLIRNWAFILPEKETLENFGQKWHLI